MNTIASISNSENANLESKIEVKVPQNLPQEAPKNSFELPQELV